MLFQVSWYELAGVQVFARKAENEGSYQTVEAFQRSERAAGPGETGQTLLEGALDQPAGFRQASRSLTRCPERSIPPAKITMASRIVKYMVMRQSEIESMTSHKATC